MLREISGWFIEIKDLESSANIYLFDHADPKAVKPSKPFYLGFDEDTTFKELLEVPKYKKDIDQSVTNVHRFYVKLITYLKSHFAFVFSDPPETHKDWKLESLP